MSTLKESITEKLNVLPELDLYQVLAFVQFLEWKKTKKNDDFDDSSPSLPRYPDPLIGLFDGPPELASQSEEILQESVVNHSGWTWKSNP